MKYVKIKDGRILDLEALKWPYICQVIDGKNYIDFNSRGMYEIVKQSDNVEELFDAILEFCPGELRPVCEVYRRKEDGELYRYWNHRGYAKPAKGNIIRGVIWTNYCLNFVAEMNEKGEWELL